MILTGFFSCLHVSLKTYLMKTEGSNHACVGGKSFKQMWTSFDMQKAWCLFIF